MSIMLWDDRGEQSGELQHTFTRGFYAEILGAGDQGIESILVKDKFYIKGPVPGFKANEAKWYLLPRSNESGAQTAQAKASRISK